MSAAADASAPVALVDQLDRIAERVALLTRLVGTLRDENQSMRHAIERSDGEKKALIARLDTARDRVESLIARMPAA